MVRQFGVVIEPDLAGVREGSTSAASLSGSMRSAIPNLRVLSTLADLLLCRAGGEARHEESL